MSRLRWRRGIALFSALAGLIVACTSDPTPTPERCTPGAYVFCRCQDRETGTKLCYPDAKTFGSCEPCETPTNPEIPIGPDDDGGPLPEPSEGGVDADADAPSKVDAAGCGNRVVDPGEDCDDDNADPNDGCDSTCRLSGAAPLATNACPGLRVHVWGGTHKPTLAGTTKGDAGNRSLKPTCPSDQGNTPTTGAAGPDRVFEVVAHKTGTLTVATTDTDYNVLVYASASCGGDDGGTEIAWISCSNKVDGVGGETITLAVVSGKSYWVFVDGALPSSLDILQTKGAFKVTFSIL